MTQGALMEQKISNIRSIVLADVDPLKDDKFLVLKRSELEQMLLELGLSAVHDEMHPADWAVDTIEAYALNDAVVIRTQDTFSGPALHAYASTIALVADVTSNPALTERLQHVADYFADRAREADIHTYEKTAKLPD